MKNINANHTDNVSLSEFEFLWQNNGKDYALVKNDNFLYKYTIFSLKNYFFVIIETDDLIEIIIKTMIENNIKVFGSFEEFEQFKLENPVIIKKPIDLQHLLKNKV